MLENVLSFIKKKFINCVFTETENTTQYYIHIFFFHNYVRSYTLSPPLNTYLVFRVRSQIKWWKINFFLQYKNLIIVFFKKKNIMISVFCNCKSHYLIWPKLIVASQTSATTYDDISFQNTIWIFIISSFFKEWCL